ncbi:MAG TPA: FtsX-like permease family protein [Gemmatimonadales bacterium]|nr:FtsX-like permease family protein [Gemmatimonadales bacterium]
MDIRISLPVLLFATAVSLASGLAAGLVPAILAGRRDPVDGIKGYKHDAKIRHRPGDALVVAQLALTVVLLSGAGLLGHSFWRLVTVDPGYRSKDVVSVRMWLPKLRYPTGTSRSVYVARALERFRAIPGVIGAAVSTSAPDFAGELSFNVANPTHPGVHELTVITESSLDFLDVLGIPLKRGRWAKSVGSAVISEAGARLYFPGEDPLGKVLTDEGRRDLTIVGVAGDTRQMGLNQDPPPQLYLPLGPDPTYYPNFVVRTSGPATAMVAPLRQSLEELDPGTPVYDIAPVSAMIAKSLATQRSYAVALGVFAFAALALAAIGIYGLVATSVARRTREIGIRIALGAERENVMGLVLRRGVMLAGLGLVIGLGGSVLGTRALKSMLFQVGAGDPLVLGAVTVALFSATLAATYFPARRAASVDPLVALRTD